MHGWLFRGIAVPGRLDIGRLEARGVTAVLGPNGSGKTTLLKVAARMLRPARGVVEGPVRVGASLQNPYLGFRGPTLVEDLEYTCGSRGEALKMLRESGLGHAADRSPFTLSAGEARIFSILLAVSWNPDGLVIDEPTSGLDLHYRRWLARMIRSLGMPVLIAGHDLDFAVAVAENAVVLSRGSPILEGSIEEVARAVSRGGLERFGVEPGPVVSAALDRRLSVVCVARCVLR